jgi:hypothetical protein
VSCLTCLAETCGIDRGDGQGSACAAKGFVRGTCATAHDLRSSAGGSLAHCVDAVQAGLAKNPDRFHDVYITPSALAKQSSLLVTISDLVEVAEAVLGEAAVLECIVACEAAHGRQLACWPVFNRNDAANREVCWHALCMLAPHALHGPSPDHVLLAVVPFPSAPQLLMP